MTKHVNDHKLEALIIQLGLDTHIDDGEWQLLINSVGPKPNQDQINDLWYRYLQGTLGLTGHINDMFYEFLISQGMTPGHINDMWHEFWETISEIPSAPRVPYEFEMLDTSIQIYQFDSFEDYELQLSVL